jgi:choline transporter-like protein 2/4/5
MVAVKGKQSIFEGGADEDKLKGETDAAEKKADLPKDMSNGPVTNRECTDLICCLVFLAFLVGMVGVSGYGLVYGDP